MTTAERVNLLVPAEVVPRLSIPETGGARPAPIRGGDLFVRGVPAAVAEQWIERNPGVHTVSRRPVVRRYPARTYTIAAVLVLIVAVQAVIVPAVGETGNPFWVWLFAPALAATGITLAYKSIPFDHVRFR
ncbi:hypothetical protein [Paractinoplanes toevensis]|uniref:Uncharacterized protein n=1 Tax=Paractinoplanes toevensis TaxID=571911 RepID=A0A919TH17_9ACTN|nr:hypothetical protein [Actinoplanes toevensis]GIM95022.1 hypothetical protein Ato02nite_068150 [Actinoplanes toevensis]